MSIQPAAVHHHGFLARLPPDGVTSFKSRGEGAELDIFV